MGHIGTALMQTGAGVPAPARPRPRREAHGGGATARDDHGRVGLAARFPVVRRLIGEESFRLVMRRFASRQAHEVGITWQVFPGFLRRQGNGASFDYLADIAELELACAKARIAAAARPVSAHTVVCLMTGRPECSRVALHPSVCVVASRFPIVTIWRSNQRDGDGMIERWRGEAALIARPFSTVEVRNLPPGGHAFVAALSDGQTVAAAVTAAAAAVPHFDAEAGRAILMDSNIVIGAVEQTTDPAIPGCKVASGSESRYCQC